ncbi:MAG: hypothetical protein HKN21_05970 [Candidatus Eisenbacteria bacterium]|uniref:Uncharacterized protein n=1 Tax=Eiseniibacteriota bacterium TaxID=2212470 RepID=A0A7Y2E6V2_UNCEI|nr:hypothetical protein [Candidatus Eisenbacteria bacterium]
MQPIRPSSPPEIKPPQVADGSPETGKSEGSEASTNTEPKAAASLWEQLSGKEQKLVQELQEMGALTYGADGKTTPPPTMPTGGRVDIKG